MADAPDQPADIMPPRDECGLALSGGGIRSATFCLGLLSALAGVADPRHPEQRLLQRFKYLSTVSGGGFTGAMFGRLFRPAADNPGYGWRQVNALLSGENRRPCAAAGTRPLRLFIQIYDETSRPAAEQLAQQAIRLGLLVPGIENVTATAARQRKAVPFVWDRRTWVLHQAGEQECARQLAGDGDRWMNLPPTLKPAQGVIELWIPPAHTAAAQ